MQGRVWLSGWTRSHRASRAGMGLIGQVSGAGLASPSAPGPSGLASTPASEGTKLRSRFRAQGIHLPAPKAVYSLRSLGEVCGRCPQGGKGGQHFLLLRGWASSDPNEVGSGG